VERCAGIDVHQAQVRVCVRTPAAAGKRKRIEEFASFGTTTPDLLALADWLAERGVTQVAMEGTTPAARTARSVSASSHGWAFSSGNATSESSALAGSFRVRSRTSSASRPAHRTAADRSAPRPWRRSPAGSPARRAAEPAEEAVACISGRLPERMARCRGV
jgi:hypothetical protein